jgi:YD repeat-containing protein
MRGLNTRCFLLTVARSWDAVRTYSYDRFNRLVSVLSGSTAVMSLDYDAAGRLATTATGAAPTDATTSQYLYNGDQPILELTGLGAIRRRFVPGPGLDNVIVQIDPDGGGVPERRWMLSDDLGSVAALTDRTGKAIRFNAYGPFGEPSSGNIGRMGYAGALTLPEIGGGEIAGRRGAQAPDAQRNPSGCGSAASSGAFQRFTGGVNVSLAGGGGIAGVQFSQRVLGSNAGTSTVGVARIGPQGGATAGTSLEFEANLNETYGKGNCDEAR